MKATKQWAIILRDLEFTRVFGTGGKERWVCIMGVVVKAIGGHAVTQGKYKE